MPRFNPEEYVQVKERIRKFRADHPEYGLRSEIVVEDERHIVMHGWVETPEGFVLADGHAEEIRGSSPVNQTSPLENCETSAWGRCLAAMGYDVDRSIASREEMEKAGGEAAATGGPAAPPADLPWQKTYAAFEKFWAPGTPGADDRKLQFKAAAAKAGVITSETDSLVFDKLDANKLDALDQIVVDLTGPL